MLMRSLSSSILHIQRISKIQKLQVCAYVISEAVVDYVMHRARAYVQAVETMAVVAAIIVAVLAVMLLRKA